MIWFDFKNHEVGCFFPTLDIRNVSPEGELSLAENTQSQTASPEVLNWVQIRWTRWIIKKTNAISQGKMLWPRSSVNNSIILMKNPVFSTSPSLKSDDRSKMRMYLAAFWCPCITCSSIVTIPSWLSLFLTVFHLKSLRCDILVMVTPLKMIRAINHESRPDHIVGILTILISNEQFWEFRYSLGNRKLIIWSKIIWNLHMVYIKKIIAINPPWNSFQNHASGNTYTLPSNDANKTKPCSSFPPIPSGGGIARRLNISRDTAQETEDYIFIFIW